MSEGCAQPIGDSGNPGQKVLGGIRKQTEQATGGDKPFPPHAGLVSVLELYCCEETPWPWQLLHEEHLTGAGLQFRGLVLYGHGGEAWRHAGRRGAGEGAELTGSRKRL